MQRLTANKYVGTAREHALTPKSMGLPVRHNNGEKETTKADAGYAERSSRREDREDHPKDQLYPWGKPLKILIVWHLKPRYGISAKTGSQLKARLDEKQCDASQIMKPQGEEEPLLHVSFL